MLRGFGANEKGGFGAGVAGHAKIWGLLIILLISSVVKSARIRDAKLERVAISGIGIDEP
jgi:hypothetical protein